MTTRCPAKHTTYQPKDEDWRCPRCGATSTSDRPFVVEYYPDNVHEDCDLLHTQDSCTCDNCGYEASGSRVAALLAKIDNVETCPCCKGRGVVPKKAGS